MNAQELLAIALLEKRTTRLQRLSEKQMEEASRQQFDATVLGYSAERQAWKVKRLDGTASYAHSVQSASPNSRVFLQKSAAGNAIDYL
jgi:hypothetical protein